MGNQSTIRILAISSVLGGLCMGLDIYWVSSVGVGVFTYFLLRLLIETGSDLPIESFILVIATAQWVIGPVMAYAGFSDHWKYRMYVSEDTYMGFVVPATIFFSIGLFTFKAKVRPILLRALVDMTTRIISRQQELPYYLIGVGIVFSSFGSYLPSFLAFPVFLLANLQYIGLIYLLYSDRVVNKNLLLMVAGFLVFLSSLQSTMFHNFLLWSAFIGMYLAIVKKPSLRKKMLFIITGLAVVFVIQVAKSGYRSEVVSYGGAGVTSFVEAIANQFDGRADQSSDNVENVVVRFNQGWIISRIMSVVPDSVPYALGGTIITAVKASLMPRILFPDKPIAGGRENYEKYTEFSLNNTSMGISLLGEAYLNFGVVGGWIFMLIIGLTWSYAIKRFLLLSQTYPSIWLWFPLLLLHVVKAETELLVQLNYLVKSGIIIYLFIWFNRRFMKIEF